LLARLRCRGDKRDEISIGKTTGGVEGRKKQRAAFGERVVVCTNTTELYIHIQRGEN